MKKLHAASIALSRLSKHDKRVFKAVTEILQTERDSVYRKTAARHWWQASTRGALLASTRIYGRMIALSRLSKHDKRVFKAVTEILQTATKLAPDRLVSQI
jgi:hypothetical protein